MVMTIAWTEILLTVFMTGYTSLLFEGFKKAGPLRALWSVPGYI
jgi:hypothetical protein